MRAPSFRLIVAVAVGAAAALVAAPAAATTWTFTPGAGNRYYYVVPRNAFTEGSYGNASSGAPHPPSSSACLPQEMKTSCS